MLAQAAPATALAIAMFFSSAAGYSRDRPLLVNAVHYIHDTIHHFSTTSPVSLIDTDASVFMTVLKIILSGFLNTLEYRDAAQAYRPSELFNK